jgi:hypothetical protein
MRQFAIAAAVVTAVVALWSASVIPVPSSASIDVMQMMQDVK